MVAALTMWFGGVDEIYDARERELQPKKWKHLWKLPATGTLDPDRRGRFEAIAH